jgi:hypothetical protein
VPGPRLAWCLGSGRGVSARARAAKSRLGPDRLEDMLDREGLGIVCSVRPWVRDQVTVGGAVTRPNESLTSGPMCAGAKEPGGEERCDIASTPAIRAIRYALVGGRAVQAARTRSRSGWIATRGDSFAWPKSRRVTR